MTGWPPSVGMLRAAAITAALGASLASNAQAAIVKVVDRKFPVGKYCPLESRASEGADLSFVAPAATVRITFSAANLDAFGQWNALHLDNVAVVEKSFFDAHQVGPVPGFADCYDPTPPDGQTTGGSPNAPAYDFDAAGTPEPFLDLFASGTTGWTGQRYFFDSGSTAPTAPASGTGTTGGSLGLGAETDGDVVVSAGRIVTGLTPGGVYVVTAWWYELANGPLTVSIGVPCPDQDGDGFVLCGSCDLQSTETCGDCNDANARCTTSCTDADADGWCVTLDCNDTAPTCTNDCAADGDVDAIPDCRDTCVDGDGDGYGTPGGAGNTCLGTDCSATNPWCNVSCVDADGDGHCPPGDCQDSNAAVADGLAEINDCLDQQCPGSVGFGVVDEISGPAGFPGLSNVFAWPTQPGATSYLAVRSSSAHFAEGCTSITTPAASWTDSTNPPTGSAFYYLVRPMSECKGSFGQKSSGVERATVCGAEAACSNGADDDADGGADCADPDCAGTSTCLVQTFSFTDTLDDDIADTAFRDFLQSATAGTNDYIFFEIVQDAVRTVAWCSENAAFYRTSYLDLAPTFGSVVSGNWNKWRNAPSTGSAWQGPSTGGNLNAYGDDCFGTWTWCSEQFSFEPQNSIFPDRTNDCEVYDLASGACGSSTGGTFHLTIRIGSSRFGACGF